MKELQLLAELVNLATKEGVYNMNQVGNAIGAINRLSKILVDNGIISKEDAERKPSGANEDSKEENEGV